MSNPTAPLPEHDPTEVLPTAEQVPSYREQVASRPAATPASAPATPASMPTPATSAPAVPADAHATHTGLARGTLVLGILALLVAALLAGQALFGLPLVYGLSPATMMIGIGTLLLVGAGIAFLTRRGKTGEPERS